ncbi:MAG: branched-chain amino acid ABC transporter permease [Chloroflexota bacterium]|nr:branched-chain amino acid ABC transporter permease [Chloroflexota bacterium]
MALLTFMVLPVVVPSSELSLPTEVCLFALFAISYDLIFGFTGLISFGQALFIGVGAYTLTGAMTTHHVALLPALLIALLTGIIVSTITGILALRTRGVYFAMVTLAFAQAAFTLAESNVGNLTGGENGLSLSGAPSWLVGPGNGAHFYFVALGALVAGFLLLRLFVQSPAGRVWQAVRENEQRALMLGYRPYAFKLLAYVISGSIATVAGALYALFVGAVSTNLFSADLTIQLLLMVIIGGAGSLWGAMLGAAIVRYLNHYLAVLSTSSFVAHLPHWLQQTLGQPLLLFGCVYLLLVYFFPQGIAGLTQRLRFIRSAMPRPGLGEIEPAADPALPELGPVAGDSEVHAEPAGKG